MLYSSSLPCSVHRGTSIIGFFSIDERANGIEVRRRRRLRRPTDYDTDASRPFWLITMTNERFVNAKPRARNNHARCGETPPSRERDRRAPRNRGRV